MFESKPGDWPYRAVLQMTAVAMLCAAGATIAPSYWLGAVLAVCAGGLAVVAAVRLIGIMRARRRGKPT
jgi:hypothetical protein